MKPIQGLWIGSRLSILERLSIASFLALGHDYHLYVYNPVAGIPSGAKMCDADEIVPVSEVFLAEGSYGAFSDVFRWELLYQRGGWWADLDVVALLPFNFASDYVFASQDAGQSEIPTSGIACAPAGAPVLAWMREECSLRRGSKIRWGELGPDLVAKAIDLFHLRQYLQPAARFCPIPWWRWQQTINPVPPELPADAYTVQFWGSMWQRNQAARDAVYDYHSLYEQLKRCYFHNNRPDAGPAHTLHNAAINR